MNKILHLSAGSNCLPNKDNISISEVDLSKIAGEQSLAAIYNLLSNELDSCNSLIINCNIGLPEQELFEIGVYIRLKRGPNWDIPIFIYSEGGIRSLYARVKYDQIGISRTNRFNLINQSEFEKDEITGSALIDLKIASMYQQELNWEDFVRKIEVKNSKDKHTIANEWAIYRWAQIIGATDISIEELNSEISSSLYFQYLKAIYPVSPNNNLPDNKLTIPWHDIKQKSRGIDDEADKSWKPKIIYIDDEADRGWNGIFWEIFKKNGIEDFFVVGYEEIKSLSKNEIIDLAVSEVTDLDADIVILDFRMHASDFSKNAANITGLEILKKIKSDNPGIQVIMFSATNKVWNLQALMDSGVDGFIVKEAPENSVDPNFTVESITKFYEIANKCLKKSFLKDLYLILTPLIEKVTSNKNKKPCNYELSINQGYLSNYYDLLKSADFLLYSNPHDLKYAFLQLILIIEDVVKNIYQCSTINEHFVEVNMYEKVICLQQLDTQIVLKLTPIQKWSRFVEGEYMISQHSKKEYEQFNVACDRVAFNYRLNCVLFFRYKMSLDESSTYSELYKLRSTSVAHLGSQQVTAKDVKKALELVDILIS